MQAFLKLFLIFFKNNFFVCVFMWLGLPPHTPPLILGVRVPVGTLLLTMSVSRLVHIIMITVDNLTTEQLAEYRTLLADERVTYLAKLNGTATDNAAQYENGGSEYGVRLTSFTLPAVEIKMGAFVGVVGSNGKVGYIKLSEITTLATGVKNGTITTLAKTVKDGCATYTTTDPALTFSYYETPFEADGVKRFVVGPKLFMPQFKTKGAIV